MKNLLSTIHVVYWPLSVVQCVDQCQCHRSTTLPKPSLNSDTDFQTTDTPVMPVSEQSPVSVHTVTGSEQVKGVALNETVECHELISKCINIPLQQPSRHLCQLFRSAFLHPRRLKLAQSTTTQTVATKP